MNELLQVKGIGEASIQKLKQNGIESIDDLIRTFPSKYEFNHIDVFASMVLNTDITLKMVVETAPIVKYIRRRLTKMVFSVTTESNSIKISIFNREFLKNSLVPGTEIVVSGRFVSNTQMIASDITKLANYQTGIIPVYRLDAISSKVFSKWIDTLIHSNLPQLKETIPSFLLSKNQVVDISTFFKIVHRPNTQIDVDEATYRIKYEELLGFFLRLEIQKQMHGEIYVKRKEYDIDKVRHYIESLPFELTADQKDATNDIFRDLKNHRQMNRLLQGDVGSGKTVCAMISSYGVVTAKEQVAIMAPTEILALQHYRSFKESLEPFGVQVGFLSSNVTGIKRTQLLNSLRNGEIDIICGTHSLIQEEVTFKHLGYIVIDEQHRFGVNQRKILREKGYTPDVLFMSATPIPRTLAITIFKDMDISSIKMMPEGRKKVQTFIHPYEEMESLFVEMRKELDKGHQAYVIVPLIDESEPSKNISLEEFKEIILNQLPNQYRVGFLHGKMKNGEKEDVLQGFYQNLTNVLVSTTVVEVGVNVINATFMAIMNANHFGLSQLHQLRGRVGRSSEQAVCYLVYDGLPEETSRLEILTQTSDGFAISEADLRFRGPGELFGNEQTGLPKFKMANFIEDQALIAKTIEDAKQLLSSTDPLAKSLREKVFVLLETYHLD